MKSGFVAIIGRPNSGKSTLINRVLGAKLSIVTPKAQTTRERVLGILTEKQGQVVFVDTPGIHKARDGGLNEYMVHEAREALDSPTVVWYLVDPSSKLKFEEPVLEMLERSKSPVLVLLNKFDLKGKIPAQAYDVLEKEVSEALQAKKVPLLGVRRISARDDLGVAELLKETWEQLPEGPAYFPPDEAGDDPLSDRPVRFFVGEQIREQLLMKLGEEVPYSCAVEIERFDENTRPPRIEAIIHVERESQKGIVVGKGGAKIKEIGMAARQDIEQFLAKPVFLGLRVKVLKEWTRDANTLKRLGYVMPKARPGGRSL
jgi:GTPase